MDRRNFLKSAAAGTTLAAQLSATGSLARRRYKDNVELSLIGFGGIVVVGQEQSAADRAVAESFEIGVNYYDVAPTYADGEAEQKLGIALKPYRKRAFLACKTTKREAAGAQFELDRSLQRLHTDHFDLYQFHAVASMKDVEQILGPKGAGETFLKAKKEGKVKYLGFSAHNAEAALHLIDHFPLDSVLFPLNFVCYEHGFGGQILEKAKQKGLARMALKALAKTTWKEGEPHTHPKCWYRPVDDRELGRQALRFTLSEDITAAIPPGDQNIYKMALELAMNFQPITQDERAQLLASAKAFEPIFRA